MKLPALVCVPFVAVAAALTTFHTTREAAQPFTYNHKSFLLNGKPLQLMGGQMDPQRIPREYWRDRLEKAKAMGLNTVFSYIYWNELEPAQGTFDWSGMGGMNDIATWYATVKDVGLHAVLRPGPYVCGEREWGGVPSWLAQVPNMTVRTNNPQFLELSDYYLGNLSAQIGSYQVTAGGPILMAQVENEYGNYANNHAYTTALAEILGKHFDILLYTNDAGNPTALSWGHIPGVLGEVDGDPYAGFGNLTAYVTQPGSKGPHLDGEYYAKWLTTWGPNATYPDQSGIGYNDKKIVDGLSWILKQGGSFSLYMFHGGTNFAFGNGGLSFGQLGPVTTSYDYAAPLNESGRPSALYPLMKQAIEDYTKSSPPEFPHTPSMMETGDIPLKPVAKLFDDLPSSTYSGWPLTMEELDQSYGYTLYRYTAPPLTTASGLLHVGDGPRDRVIVYINGTKQGVIDAIYSPPQNVSIDINAGDVLDLLVENLGRVDYWTTLLDQRKGIIGNVYVGTHVIAPWSLYTFPVSSPPSALTTTGAAGNHALTVGKESSPVWYKGTFTTGHRGAAADTYLEIKGGVKGVLYVNGYNLGRYWTVGPQQSLYVPGAWLQETNEIVVLELEPSSKTQLVASGIKERAWYNNEDPDCPGCSSVNFN